MPGVPSSSYNVWFESDPEGFRGWRDRSPVFRGYRPQDRHTLGPFKPQPGFPGLLCSRCFRETGWQLPMETLPSLMNGCCCTSIDRALCLREATCLSLVNPCRPGPKQDAFCALGSAPGQDRHQEKVNIWDEGHPPKARSYAGPSHLSVWLI